MRSLPTGQASGMQIVTLLAEVPPLGDAAHPYKTNDGKIGEGQHAQGGAS
jgi:hypothetical protein